MVDFFLPKYSASQNKLIDSILKDTPDPTPAEIEAAYKEASATMFGNQTALAGASVFSSVANMYSAWSASKTEKALYEIQARMQALQARAAQNQAEDILRAGNQKVAAITYQAGLAKASTRASMAAAGIRVGTGNSAEVLASHDIVKEMQVNQTIANTITQSYGAKRQVVNASNKALAIEAQAKGISPWAAALNKGVASLYDGMEKGYLPNVFKNAVGEDSGLKG